MTIEFVPPHPRPTTQELLDTSEHLEGAFAQAVALCGLEERAISLAGKVVLLRFAGRSMVDQIMPSFAHLALAAPWGAVDLTVSTWDSTSTTVGLPKNRLFPPVLGNLAVPPLYHSSKLILGVPPGDQALSVLDTERSRALYVAADAAALPVWERASPLRFILNWWLQLHGLQLVHSGSVGRPGGGVLLAGKGGSGKSTSTLECHRSGLQYAGDDYVLLQPRPPMVYSLYCSAKLEIQQCARHPDLLPQARLVADSDDKCLGFVGTAYPDCIAKSLPVVAVLLPIVAGRPRTAIVPASPARALLAIGPATIFQLRNDGSTTLSALKRLLNEVPSFLLEVGTQLETIPEAISSLLDELGVPG